MDMKSAVAIALLLLIIGLTAYVKKGKISKYELISKGESIAQGFLNNKAREKPTPRFNMTFNGNCMLSGSGIASGVSRFYFPGKTRVGNNVEASKWITLNLSSAQFTLGSGISISGKASWIELDNGKVEKELSVSFKADRFEISGYGNIGMNCTGGAMKAGELSINSDSASITGFSGDMSYNGTVTLRGKAEKAWASRSGIKYTVS